MQDAQDAPDPRPQRLQMSSRHRRFEAASVIPEDGGARKLKSPRHA